MSEVPTPATKDRVSWGTLGTASPHPVFDLHCATTPAHTHRRALHVVWVEMDGERIPDLISVLVDHSPPYAPAPYTDDYTDFQRTGRYTRAFLSGDFTTIELLTYSGLHTFRTPIYTIHLYEVVHMPGMKGLHLRRWSDRPGTKSPPARTRFILSDDESILWAPPMPPPGALTAEELAYAAETNPTLQGTQ